MIQYHQKKSSFEANPIRSSSLGQMPWSTLLQTVFIGLVVPSLCDAGPLQVDSTTDQPQRLRLHQRQASNCSSIREPSNECFSSVDLGSYVQGWLQSNTCQAGEGFSTCYLRQNGLSGSDCTKIADNLCPSSRAPHGITLPIVYTIANIQGESRFADPGRPFTSCLMSHTRHQRIFHRLVYRRFSRPQQRRIDRLNLEYQCRSLVNRSVVHKLQYPGPRHSDHDQRHPDQRPRQRHRVRGLHQSGQFHRPRHSGPGDIDRVPQRGLQRLPHLVQPQPKRHRHHRRRGHRPRRAIHQQHSV